MEDRDDKGFAVAITVLTAMLAIVIVVIAFVGHLAGVFN